MWRSWSRSYATGSRAHEDRDHLIQSWRPGFTRSDTALSAQPLQRSRHPTPAVAAARPAGEISRRPPCPQSAGYLCPHRWQLANPRPDGSTGSRARGDAWAGTRMARLRLYALLASDDGGRRTVGKALSAGPYRAAAALSAILYDDDRFVAEGLESGGEHGGARGADANGVLLSRRGRLHRGIGRASEAGPARGGQSAAARALFRAWPAGAGDQGRRPVSVAGRVYSPGDRRPNRRAR